MKDKSSQRQQQQQPQPLNDNDINDDDDEDDEDDQSYYDYHEEKQGADEHNRTYHATHTSSVQRYQQTTRMSQQSQAAVQQAYRIVQPVVVSESESEHDMISAEDLNSLDYCIEIPM